jgi:hypothetical protein
VAGLHPAEHERARRDLRRAGAPTRSQPVTGAALSLRQPWAQTLLDVILLVRPDDVPGHATTLPAPGAALFRRGMRSPHAADEGIGGRLDAKAHVVPSASTGAPPGPRRDPPYLLVVGGFEAASASSTLEVSAGLQTPVPHRRRRRDRPFVEPALRAAVVPAAGSHDLLGRADDLPAAPGAVALLPVYRGVRPRSSGDGQRGARGRYCNTLGARGARRRGRARRRRGHRRARAAT